MHFVGVRRICERSGFLLFAAFSDVAAKKTRNRVAHFAKCVLSKWTASVHTFVVTRVVLSTASVHTFVVTRVQSVRNRVPRYILLL